MKKSLTILFAAVCCAMSVVFTSCNEYNALLKSPDSDLRYEVAKQYFYDGRFNRCSTLLNDLLAATKGTERGQEALYMLAMANYKAKNYNEASEYFKKYYETYPRGYYGEDARLYSSLALYKNTPEPILD